MSDPSTAEPDSTWSDPVPDPDGLIVVGPVNSRALPVSVPDPAATNWPLVWMKRPRFEIGPAFCVNALVGSEAASVSAWPDAMLIAPLVDTLANVPVSALLTLMFPLLTSAPLSVFVPLLDVSAPAFVSAPGWALIVPPWSAI